MKIVYLDHQILINKAGWGCIKSMSDAGHIRVAISTWNIREIAQGLRERDERAAFLMSIAPLYVHDMLILQRLEVVSFLSKNLFRTAPIKFSAFADSYADFLRLNFNSKVRREFSLADYLRAEGDVQGDIVDQRKDEHVEAMRTRLADRAGVHSLEEQINHAQMANLIPRRNFRGEPWEPKEIAEILTFCQLQRKDLLLACPTVWAEDALSIARLADPNRKPRPTNTADLFHSVVALANADVFVTEDGWARDCAVKARLSIEGNGGKGATILRTVEEIEAASKSAGP